VLPQTNSLLYSLQFQVQRSRLGRFCAPVFVSSGQNMKLGILYWKQTESPRV